jgi:hypothetical protein
VKDWPDRSFFTDDKTCGTRETREKRARDLRNLTQTHKCVFFYFFSEKLKQNERNSFW